MNRLRNAGGGGGAPLTQRAIGKHGPGGGNWIIRAEPDAALVGLVDVLTTETERDVEAAAHCAVASVPVRGDNRDVKPYLSICGIYRDEAFYLREWIEFHRLVGVERFYLYDNFSEDDHREVLAPYVESGTVVLHEWPLMPGQLEAYAHCLGAYRDESRWIAFIDHDEFLFSPTMRPVVEILHEFEECPGVVANCLAFGTSGHMTRPPGLVIENYTRRTEFERRNRIVKSIVNPLRVARPGNDPHYFRYLDRAKAVNERREVVRGDRSESLACDLLRINHYITRSQEERDRKLAGLVAFTGEPKRADRAKELDKMLDDVVDETILAYLPQLRQALGDPVGPSAA